METFCGGLVEQSSLVNKPRCSRSAPCVGCLYPSVMVVPTVVGLLTGRAGLWPGFLQSLNATATGGLMRKAGPWPGW